MRISRRQRDAAIHHVHHAPCYPSFEAPSLKPRLSGNEPSLTQPYPVSFSLCLNERDAKATGWKRTNKWLGDTLTHTYMALFGFPSSL